MTESRRLNMGFSSQFLRPFKWAYRHLRAITRSVRFMVTFWQALILAGVLAAFSMTLYINTRASFTRALQQRLVLVATGTHDMLFSYWRAERSASMAPGNWEKAPSGSFPELAKSNTLKPVVLRWAEKTNALNSGEFIRVLNLDGNILATSPAFAALGYPVSFNAHVAISNGRALFETVPQPDKAPMQLATYPVRENGEVLYALQVALSMEEIEASLLRLRKRLTWLLACALLLTIIVGWCTASWSLQPVGRMIRQVQRLGLGPLSERIDVPQTDDELERLAATFNAMLERVESSFRRLRQFSAAASHELRTPLTAMKGELEVTLRRKRTVEEYEESLRTQLEALEDMALTVQELLALAREDATGNSVDKQPVDCARLVEDTGKAWQKLAVNKQVEVQLSTGEPLWVLGERRLLERLLANLLDNALRHTPPGGQIQVSTNREESKAQMVVTDTGGGIAADEMPYIFDRFFKPRAVKTEGSTGLGLGLCRLIAEAHQGSIDVANAPNQGAMFTVSLPLLNALYLQSDGQ